jgi:hypothetical protein
VAEDLGVGLVIADRVAEVPPLAHAEPRTVAVTDEIDRRDRRRAARVGRGGRERHGDDQGRRDGDQRQGPPVVTRTGERVTNDAAVHPDTDVRCAAARRGAHRLGNGEG